MCQSEAWRVRPLLRLAAVGLALGAVPSPLIAVQQADSGAGAELDAGRFQIVVDGAPIGMEVFAIRRVGTKVRAVGRFQVEDGKDPWWPYEVRMQTNADLEPEIYELRYLAGPSQTVVGRRTESGLMIHTATDAGERFKEFGTGSGTLILERGAAHHFVLLILRLASGGGGVQGGTVPVIVPSENRATTARVRRLGDATRTIGGRQVAVTRYEVQLDSGVAEVWVDSGGRVLRVAMPDNGWQATRTEGE